MNIFLSAKTPPPSPLTGRGQGEGWLLRWILNSVFKFPLTLILSPKGRGKIKERNCSFSVFGRNFLILLAIGLCFAFLGCGYQMAGRGASQLPPHLKTIAIPLFENHSTEPAIQRPFTEALRRAFITDGRLQLVNDQAEADLVLTGALTQYSIRAVSFNDVDVAIEYFVSIAANVKVVERVENQTYLKQSLTTRWDYFANDSVITSEASRQAALVQSYRLLSQRVVSMVNDKF